MENERRELYEQLAHDLKALSNLNAAILYNKSYNKLLGPTIMKSLERAETHIDKVRGDMERKYLILDNNADIVELYKAKNKNERVDDIIKRLEKLNNG